MLWPLSCATECTDDPLGTRSAEAAGLPTVAATTAIFEPPAAAKTGGASPTAPMSIEPEPIACSMGGPEVKSDQSALNGSLLMSPAAVSRAWEPDPAWSPMCRVKLDRLVVEPDAVAP